MCQSKTFSQVHYNANGQKYSNFIRGNVCPWFTYLCVLAPNAPSFQHLVPTCRLQFMVNGCMLMEQIIVDLQVIYKVTHFCLKAAFAGLLELFKRIVQSYLWILLEFTLESRPQQCNVYYSWYSVTGYIFCREINFQISPTFVPHASCVNNNLRVSKCISLQSAFPLSAINIKTPHRRKCYECIHA